MYGITSKKLVDYFNVSKELLKYFPEILRDLFELGSFPKIIIELIKDLQLPDDTVILDAGCGKAGVSIQIAKEFGYKIHCIDFYKPFLREAENNAAINGVSHLCKFELADLKTVNENFREYDLVLFTAVGNIFGSLKKNLNALKKFIKPDGYLIFDDGYRKDEQPIDFPGYESIETAVQARIQIHAAGFEIVHEGIVEPQLIAELNRANNKMIEGRINKILDKVPELNNQLMEFIDREIKECEIIENKLVNAILVLKLLNKTNSTII